MLPSKRQKSSRPHEGAAVPIIHVPAALGSRMCAEPINEAENGRGSGDDVNHQRPLWPEHGDSHTHSRAVVTRHPEGPAANADQQPDREAQK
jgi:hypothetical protein